MSCPTCDHTMQKVVYGIFWCPRCGTLMQEGGTAEMPGLVERCRELAAENTHSSAFPWPAWRRLGIAEAINLPENR